MSNFRPLAEIENSWPACSPGAWPTAGAPGGGVERRIGTPPDIGAVLARTIEAEVIPRLMLANEHASADMAPRNAAPTSEDVAEFVRLVLSHDPSVGAAFIETIRARGVTLDAVFLQLFAPSARYLGELWKSDIYDFTEVTIALLTLHTYVRQLSAEFGQGVRPTPHAPSALLATTPAEQHTFGLMILREFVQRAGWNAVTEHPKTAEELVNMARGASYRVIGLSVSCDVPVETLATLIRTLRRATRNPDLHIMVGGRFFLEHPDFITRVGANSTAQDGRRAVRLLSSLLDTNTMR
jgi:MerR family transcriptional regulator, light-induced transcriptional regulator